MPLNLNRSDHDLDPARSGEPVKRLIKFKVETGDEIVVEARVHEPVGGVVKAKSPEGVVLEAAQTFEQALEKIKPAAEVIIAKGSMSARGAASWTPMTSWARCHGSSRRSAWTGSTRP